MVHPLSIPLPDSIKLLTPGEGFSLGIVEKRKHVFLIFREHLNTFREMLGSLVLKKGFLPGLVKADLDFEEFVVSIVMAEGQLDSFKFVAFTKVVSPQSDVGPIEEHFLNFPIVGLHLESDSVVMDG